MSEQPTPPVTPTLHPLNEATFTPCRTRSGTERRDVVDRRTGLERLRGPGRRRTDFERSAEEGQMTGEQFLFVMAIDAFKRVNKKSFPSWTEVLEVIRKLGYRKTMPSDLNLSGAEDWTEAPNTPAVPPLPIDEDEANDIAATD